MPQSEFWPFSQKIKSCKDVTQPRQSCQLQKQLGDIEGEVKEIQMELAAIKRNRTHCPETPPKKDQQPEQPTTDKDKEKNEIDVKVEENEEAPNDKPDGCVEICSKSVFDVNFQRVQSVCQASCETRDSRRCSPEEACLLKNQARSLREEIEEMRVTIEEKSEQLQEYRIRYLQAEQCVEELKRQIDVMDFDNKQASDQIQIELQKMKMQFQEKLMELAPLPDLLKGAQIQLQEALQLQRLAEDSAQQISTELQRVKEKLICVVNQLNQEKLEKCKILELNTAHMTELEQKNKEIECMCSEIESYQCKVARLEQKLCSLEKRLHEKCCEYQQLCQELCEFKKDSAKALCRVKERAESNRRCYQNQLNNLERQLACCKGQCRTYQKERDEIRHRMQLQICNLKENFNMVECRLRGLQGQVALLKHCYAVAHPDTCQDTACKSNDC